MTVFALLLDLAILGILAYLWVRVVRRRGIFAKGGSRMRLRQGLVLAILLFTTGVFIMALVWGIPSLFE